MQVLFRFFHFLHLSSLERRRLGRLVLGVALLMGLSSAGYLLTESTPEAPLGLEDALWWSIVTMTTVGYGDMFPVTWQGRWLVAVPTMVLGIGVIGYAIGLLTTFMVERLGRRRRGMADYTGSDHVLICHLPSTEVVLEIVGEVAADPDWKQCRCVLVSGEIEALPDELADAGVVFVQGEPSRELVLKRAGVERARAAVVLATDRRDPRTDNQSLGAIVTLRALAPELPIVTECVADENVALLSRAGAREVVETGRLRAGLLVQGLQDPGVGAVVAELLSNQTGHQLYVQTVAAFSGPYRELRDRVQASGRTVALGLIVHGEHRLLPDADEPVPPGARLVSLGDARPQLG